MRTGFSILYYILNNVFLKIRSTKEMFSTSTILTESYFYCFKVIINLCNALTNRLTCTGIFLDN